MSLTPPQAYLRPDSGPMTLLSGFAAGTPGFSPVMASYGSLAVIKALQVGLSHPLISNKAVGKIF